MGINNKKIDFHIRLPKKESKILNKIIKDTALSRVEFFRKVLNGCRVRKDKNGFTEIIFLGLKIKSGIKYNN